MNSPLAAIEAAQTARRTKITLQKAISSISRQIKNKSAL